MCPDSPRAVRILFLADTHQGFDTPSKPRVHRRRRGPDFLAAYRRALSPALEGRVDLLVHGGDLFFRSRVPDALIENAFEPLLQIADRGVPVFIVPGNHERSVIPLTLFESHARIFVFDRPRTFIYEKPPPGRVAVGSPGRSITVGLSGFPFVREGVRGRYPEIV